MFDTARAKLIVVLLATLILVTACGGWDPAVKNGSGNNGRPNIQKTIDTMLVRDPDLQRFFDSAHGYAAVSYTHLTLPTSG